MIKPKKPKKKQYFGTVAVKFWWKSERKVSYLLIDNLHFKMFIIWYNIGTYFSKRLKINKSVDIIRKNWEN